MDATIRPILVLAIAYLLGSIPFGYLIVRFTQGADIRETGSGGTGATNVSRRAGKVAGVATLMADAAKGAAAVLIASLMMGVRLWAQGNDVSVRTTAPMEIDLPLAYWTVAGAAIAVIVGHLFPIWLKFRGGKGVATGVGVFLLLNPWAVLFAAVIFILIVWRTRYVSLGSIIAAATIPVTVWIQGMFMLPAHFMFVPLLAAATAGAALIIFAHRANMQRLIDGRESRFS